MDSTSGVQQPLNYQIQKETHQKSARVKSIDLHPTKPWILASLHSGLVNIWNYNSQALEMSFTVAGSPVRSAKFIARENWFVTGADDKLMRVYQYDTKEKVKEFEAHTDYIRSVAVHPTLPYVLSSSDDTDIKLWDWEKDWVCTKIFKGHGHYVMQVAFDPRDSNIFASASLDCTIKVWKLSCTDPVNNLEAHPKGINCIDFFKDYNESFLITGSDDYTAKVNDYQSSTCRVTLEGHTHNVNAVCSHPDFPIIITGSEDGTVRVWHNTTHRLLNTITSDLGRVWAVACMKNSGLIAIGCDEGTLVGKITSSLV